MIRVGLIEPIKVSLYGALDKWFLDPRKFLFKKGYSNIFTIILGKRIISFKISKMILENVGKKG